MPNPLSSPGAKKKIVALIELVDNDLGYRLYQAVEKNQMPALGQYSQRIPFSRSRDRDQRQRAP